MPHYPTQDAKLSRLFIILYTQRRKEELNNIKEKLFNSWRLGEKRKYKAVAA
jgi:hypothetical protein